MVLDLVGSRFDLSFHTVELCIGVIRALRTESVHADSTRSITQAPPVVASSEHRHPQHVAIRLHDHSIEFYFHKRVLIRLLGDTYDFRNAVSLDPLNLLCCKRQY